MCLRGDRSRVHSSQDTVPGLSVDKLNTRHFRLLPDRNLGWARVNEVCLHKQDLPHTLQAHSELMPQIAVQVQEFVPQSM